MKLGLLPPLAALLLAALVACEPADSGRQTRTQPPVQVQVQPSRDPDSGLHWIEREELPPEGQEVLGRIGRGGPFAYRKDGSVFGNRERRLPQKASSYYREYTVKTPGEADRGARRIICGGQPVTRTAECYYSADHYASFRRIRP